jgi:murein DD-endopeptidase MepM/ murein hydrolase activator NlpD
MSGTMRRALIVLSGALTLASAVAPPSAAVPDRLERVERQLKEKQERLEETKEESRDAREQLAESQQRRQELTAEVRGLQDQLLVAQADLEAVQAELEAAQEELVRWTARLRRAREDLVARQEALNERAATAYVVGPTAFVEAIFGAPDLASISDRTFYVERVLTVDMSVLEGMRIARTLVSDRQDRVERYEGRVEEHVEVVQERTEQIAAMKAEQESLLGQIDLEIQSTAATLGDLTAARDQYEAAVAALEAESARIQGLIQGTGSTGSGQIGGELAWPTAGAIVSGFGYRTHPIYGTTRFHSGVDIDGACGQPIFAAEDGTVLSAGSNGGYGLATVVDHGNGLSTLYGHQSSLGVSSGQRVERGQQIGLVGTTGLSTGCHLHFEVRVNGEPVDPVPYLT